MRFFGGSLEENVKALTNKGVDKAACGLTNAYFHQFAPGRMAEKMDFPYEFLTTFDCLRAQPVPERRAFTSRLTKKGISKEDHAKLEEMAIDLGVTDFEAMLRVYNKTDVLLLADCLLNFRSVGLRLFDLDCLKFTGLPAMGWQAMLRMTKARLEPLRDIEHVKMFEKARRGGICFLNHKRYVGLATPSPRAPPIARLVVTLDADS
jgi:hypothetical protein